MICDEGHRIKNDQSNISQALKRVHTRFVMSWRNHEKYWSQNCEIGLEPWKHYIYIFVFVYCICLEQNLELSLNHPIYNLSGLYRETGRVLLVPIVCTLINKNSVNKEFLKQQAQSHGIVINNNVIYTNNKLNPTSVLISTKKMQNCQLLFSMLLQL